MGIHQKRTAVVISAVSIVENPPTVVVTILVMSVPIRSGTEAYPVAARIGVYLHSVWPITLIAR